MLHKIFAVVGKPVLHSLSPQMHNAAFAALGLDAVYTRLAAASAEEALKTAEETGMSGLNITAPFKENFAALAGSLSDEANALGAVNTLVIRDGKTVGFNTDIGGVANALLENGVEMSGRKSVVIGAGGAAKAAVFALLKQGATVTVANRTEKKAKALGKKLGCAHCSLEENELGEALADADILVSTLSTKERVIPPKLLRKGMAVLDAVYSGETAISKDAKARGCRVIGGKEWLLHQGTDAFELFSQRKAPIADMRKAVEAAMRHEDGRKKRNIALIGFMGSGKTTVAKEIAGLSGMEMAEIDDGIVKKAGMSIARIFEDEGEEAFRRMERAEIAKVEKMDGCVISCGGGAILNRENREVLGKNCTVIWLWTTPKEIVRRIGSDNSRPLMNNKDRLQAATKILGRRLPHYAACADLIVRTEGRNPKQVARLVLDEVSKPPIAKGDGTKR